MIHPDIIITTRAAQAEQDRELAAAAERVGRAPQSDATTDKPSEGELRALAKTICTAFFYCDTTKPDGAAKWMREDKQRMAEALAAWRWCRERMEREVQPATVGQIAAIIQAHSDKPEISMSRWSRAASEIAALFAAPPAPADIAALQHSARTILARYDSPDASLNDQHAEPLRALAFLREFAARTFAAAAPAVPAEIVERAKEIVERFDDARSTPMHEDAARSDAFRLVRDIAAQPTPAPDPRAVEIAKRLPWDCDLEEWAEDGGLNVAWTVEQRRALADAAAYVRRAAGEQGA